MAEGLPEQVDRRVWRSSFSQLGSRVVGLLSNLVLIGLLARRLSAQDFGAWLVLINLFQIVIALDLGLAGSLRNFASKAFVRGRDREIHDHSFSLFLFLLVMSVVFAAVALFTPWIIEAVGLAGGYYAPFAVAAVTGALIVPAGLFGQLTYSYLEAHLLAIAEAARSVAQLAFIAAAVWYGGGLFACITGYSLVYFISVAAVSGAFLAKRKWYLRDYFRENWNRRLWPHLRTIMIPAGLMALSQIAAFINTGITTIIVARVLSLDDAGRFGAVFKLYAGVAGLQLAFLVPFWGAYALKHATGDLAWIRQTLVRLGLVTLAGSLALAVFMLFFGPAIVHLWTSLTIADPRLYGLLAVWAALTMLANCLAMFLNGSGRFLGQAVILAVTGALLIPFAVYGGYHWGVNGVVLATIVTTALLFIGLTFEVRREMRRLRSGSAAPCKT